MISSTGDVRPESDLHTSEPDILSEAERKRVLVIGAGVSGLTTALCLGRAGFGVTVLADRFAPNVTSVVAGALWEWPPAVCGHHVDPTSLLRSKEWSRQSYGIFTDLASDPSTGVTLRLSNFYYHSPIESDPATRRKVQELSKVVAEFRHDPALISENGINPTLGLTDAYTFLSPTVDTDVYMRWILAQCRLTGIELVTRELTETLQSQESQLLSEFQAHAIVNCTGLGATSLVGDEVLPLRGALVRLRNDGTMAPRITQAHCVSRTEADGFVFILPRGDDMLVLGGIAEVGQSDLGIGLDNYEPVRAMYQRCLEFLPSLAQFEIDASEPVRVGLRPLRAGNVRLEDEPGTRIVHNYGHGGSGVTFSWGCAFEVVETVEAMVARDARSASSG